MPAGVCGEGWNTYIEADTYTLRFFEGHVTKYSPPWLPKTLRLRKMLHSGGGARVAQDGRNVEGKGDGNWRILFLIAGPERVRGGGSRFARLHDPEGNPIELWQPMPPVAAG